MSNDQMEQNLSERCSSEQDIFINSSAIVKTNFLTLDLSRKKLTKVPPLMPKTQRLIATENHIFQWPPLNCIHNIKYLDLSNNLLKTIPHALNQLDKLQTLKLNNNLITRLVAIYTVRTYVLWRNPIEKMQLDCWKMNMEQFGFDWLNYLEEKENDVWEGEKLEDFRMKLSRYVSDQVNKCLDFEEFMKYYEPLPKMQKKNMYLAISSKNNKYFDYIDGILTDECPQQWQYDGKLLFQVALIEKNEAALKFFRKQKFSKNKNIPFLHICARHGDFEFFKLMISRGYSLHSNKNVNSLLHQVVANFNVFNSPPILRTILKFTNNPNCKNQRRLNCLVYAAFKHPNKFTQFLKYLTYNRDLAANLNFEEVCGISFLENSLHLAARTGDPKMTFWLIQLCLTNPFIKNSQNKRPRTITTHYMVRKLLAKYQKWYFNKIFKKVPNIKTSESEEIYMSLPSVKSQDDISQSKFTDFQLELCKSLPKTDKIGHLLKLLYDYNHQFEGLKFIRRLLESLSKIHTSEDTILQLILSYLSKATGQQYQQIIEEQLNKLVKMQLMYEQPKKSSLALYEEFHGIRVSRVLGNRYQSAESSVLPFSFNLCAEVDIASESVITVEPKVMKTYRAARLEKKGLGNESSFCQGGPPQKNMRRLSLTFYR